MNFNQREQKMIKKANEELQTVQANCTARLFDLKDIEEVVQTAKDEFASLDSIERKWLVELTTTLEYSVPVSYNWSAKTSRIDVTLNRYGTLVAIEVGRIPADMEPYGGKKWRFRIKYE